MSARKVTISSINSGVNHDQKPEDSKDNINLRLDVCETFYKKVKTCTPELPYEDIFSISNNSNILGLKTSRPFRQSSILKNSSYAAKKVFDSGRSSYVDTHFAKSNGLVIKKESMKQRYQNKRGSNINDEDEKIIGKYVSHQAVVLNKFARRTNSITLDQIDKNIATLQKQIIENQETQRETRECIKNINKNQDIKYLLKIHEEDYKSISAFIKSKERKNGLSQDEGVTEELKKLCDKIAYDNTDTLESATGIDI